jgi:signal peptidase
MSNNIEHIGIEGYREKNLGFSPVKEKKKSLAREGAELVLAFVFAVVVYYGLSFALGTPMPIVSVVSESMEPVLQRGDLLVVVAPSDLKVSDVVIYQRLDTRYTIVHRIIEEKPEGYVIKGDNNQVPDPGIVRKEQILGKVVYAVPLLGYPRLALFALGI